MLTRHQPPMATPHDISTHPWRPARHLSVALGHLLGLVLFAGDAFAARQSEVNIADVINGKPLPPPGSAAPSTDGTRAPTKSTTTPAGRRIVSGPIRARSIGSPNDGRQEGAARLTPSSSVLLKGDARPWGTPELVRLIKLVAAEVRSTGSGAMLVGDLSLPDGGPIDKHNSHQSGRDVDIGFYVTNSKGRPYQARDFLPFGADGRSLSLDWARFDDARNWQLVRSLLKTRPGLPPVQVIFVSGPLRQRLLAYGRRHGAPQRVLERASTVLMSPHDAPTHNDHFHVRVSCPERMRGSCLEFATAEP